MNKNISDLDSNINDELDSLFDDNDNSMPLFDEEVSTKEQQEDAENNAEKWRIMIVDDDEEIHRSTKFVLSNFEFEEKSLNFISAYSSIDAMEKLKENEDIAIIFLDVVMEKDDAGLQLVGKIRQELQNTTSRIILRTGQPGYAPEKDVIVKYDINDYKAKSELDIDKLHTSVVTALRDYKNLITIKQHNLHLEDLVKERTAEVEKKNKQLTDSIYYAKRIQKAILPSKDDVKKLLPKSFIFYQPKDIVSGDFYWIKKIKEKTIIVAADCTGHGVPGAFMTIIGSTMLDQVTSNTNITNSSSSILDSLKVLVIDKLAYQDDLRFANDTIDLGLAIIDYKNQKLHFSGAFNPLIQIRDNEIKEIKGDKFPIGKHFKKTDKTFNEHEVDMLQGDMFYMFSDGYQDQIGGKDNDKFFKSTFKELLLSIHKLPVEKQEEIIKTTINDWMGGNKEKQTDDMLVVGFRIP